MNKWQRVPDGTDIEGHWLVGNDCRWCRFSLRVFTSAKPSGTEWYWNGRGGTTCPTYTAWLHRTRARHTTP